MKRLPFAAAVVVAFFLSSGACLAHRVNVFAYVDGDAVQVECGFSRSQKVKNGRVVVTDLETGDVVLEGVTDAGGLFRFRPSDAFLASGHGLNIRLYAGEGHQDDWRMSGEELRALSPAASSVDGVRTTSEEDVSATPEAAAENVFAGGRGRIFFRPDYTDNGSAILDAARLEAVIGAVLDEKLAPIRRELARQREDGPGIREIVGGIGWIVGLLGLVTYMKYKRGVPRDPE